MKLKSQGEPYYYVVRERFNAAPSSLDFLFLNRSCSMASFVSIAAEVQRALLPQTGAIRASLRHEDYQSGAAIAQVLSAVDWTFEVQDFRATLAQTARVISFMPTHHTPGVT